MKMMSVYALQMAWTAIDRLPIKGKFDISEKIKAILETKCEQTIDLYQIELLCLREILETS